jgi:hypothetical protein
MWPADARAIFADRKQNALGTRLSAAALKFARFVLQVGGSVLKFLLGELVLIQAWDSIMTPGQDFIEPDTVLKCGALQIKLPVSQEIRPPGDSPPGRISKEYRPLLGISPPPPLPI